MIKSLIKFDINKNEKNYGFYCEPDAPLGEIHDVLHEMLRMVIEKMKNILPEEKKEECPKEKMDDCSASQEPCPCE